MSAASLNSLRHAKREGLQFPQQAKNRSAGCPRPHYRPLSWCTQGATDACLGELYYTARIGHPVARCLLTVSPEIETLTDKHHTVTNTAGGAHRELRFPGAGQILTKVWRHRRAVVKFCFLYDCIMGQSFFLPQRNDLVETSHEVFCLGDHLNGTHEVVAGGPTNHSQAQGKEQQQS